LRSEPAGGGADPTCWHLKSLAAGTKRVFRVTAQVGPLLSSALAHNFAWASAANVRGVRTTRATVRVKPLPNTACGSALTRPSGATSAFEASGVALRC
jgi:hypothetical protein